MKILIIKPSSLGDIIHGLQVVNEIRCKFETATIDWVVRDCFADVVRLSGIVDNVFLFHRHGGLGKFCSLIRSIRANYYDYVLDMQGLARSGVLTLFARAGKKIGRKDSRELSCLAYNDKIDLPQAVEKHAIDILLQFLCKFNLPTQLTHNLKFNISSEFILPELQKANLDKCICIFPNSRRSEKEWPYFHELVTKLSYEYNNFKIFILGDKCLNIKSENVVDLTNKTSISDMIFLIQHANLVIANDSAPIHLASAIETKVLGLFGPTDPEKYGPYQKKNAKILFADNGKLCNLRPEVVLEEIRDMLQ